LKDNLKHLMNNIIKKFFKGYYFHSGSQVDLGATEIKFIRNFRSRNSKQTCRNKSRPLANKT